MQKKKGISLIVLVITIIVMVILASTIVISLSSSNVISKAEEAVFKSDMKTYMHEYQIYSALYVGEGNDLSTLNVAAGQIHTILPSISNNSVYSNKMKVVNGALMYDADLTDALDAQRAIWASEAGLIAGLFTITADNRADIGYTDATTDLVIPETIVKDGVTYAVVAIGNKAFRDCSALENIIIPNSVTSIGDHAFYNCTSLKSIIIPNGITKIDKWTFAACSKLTSVTIPASVTSIIGYTFYNDTALTDITFDGTKSQWNAITKDNGWDAGTGNYTIHCTDGDITK